MANYILSKKAQEDLLKIWLYTVETWSGRQADIYYNNLIQSFEYISDNPDNAGRSYEEVRFNYRGVHCGRHIIFYRKLKNGRVRIIRILHEKMDFGRHFSS